MKNSKKVYLFLALLLPILFSVFLKFFGKSEFNIPIYYEQGVDSLTADCSYPYTTPYRIADSVTHHARKVTVITIDSSVNAKKNFQRIDEDLVNAEYNFVVLENSELSNELMSCALFLRKPWTTVLIDEQNRIRGYYAPGTREETDRLMVELRILLKQY